MQSCLDQPCFGHADVITLNREIQVMRESLLNGFVQRNSLRRIRRRLLSVLGESQSSRTDENCEQNRLHHWRLRLCATSRVNSILSRVWCFDSLLQSRLPSYQKAWRKGQPFLALSVKRGAARCDSPPLI